jgi:hypothetical protein
MTEHERALLLFVADRLCERLYEQAQATWPIPRDGYGYPITPHEWQEVYDLENLICAVKEATTDDRP